MRTFWRKRLEFEEWTRYVFLVVDVLLAPFYKFYKMAVEYVRNDCCRMKLYKEENGALAASQTQREFGQAQAPDMLLRYGAEDQMQTGTADEKVGEECFA